MGHLESNTSNNDKGTILRVQGQPHVSCIRVLPFALRWMQNTTSPFPQCVYYQSVVDSDWVLICGAVCVSRAPSFDTDWGRETAPFSMYSFGRSQARQAPTAEELWENGGASLTNPASPDIFMERLCPCVFDHFYSTHLTPNSNPKSRTNSQEVLTWPFCTQHYSANRMPTMEACQGLLYLCEKKYGNRMD